MGRSVASTSALLQLLQLPLLVIKALLHVLSLASYATALPECVQQQRSSDAHIQRVNR
jgi:hypothetical protein